MIVLDTNVLSELMRPRPADAVSKWIARQPATSLFTTAVTQAELLLGVRLLPAGKRRTALEEAVQAMFDEDFAGRILAFDHAAALAYAAIVAARRENGRPISHISQFDAQIAAVARRAGAALATRNTTDFHDCGLTLIDPWTQ